MTKVLRMGLVQKVAIILLCYLISQGSAIRCFSCSNLHDERCGDVFRLLNTAAKECSGSCMKYRGERYSGSVRMVEVNRRCVQQRTEDCFDTQYNRIDVRACACNTDFCNGSSRLSVSLLGVATGLLVMICKM